MKTTPLTQHAHYNVAEIIQMWNRQAEPCRHDKKAFDIVGYLNR